MSFLLAAAVGTGLAIVSRRPALGLGAAVVGWQPLGSVGLGVGALALRWIRSASPRARQASADDVVLYGELVGLGLAAGLPFVVAADRASREVAAPLADEVGRVLRAAQSKGTASALAAAEGEVGPLFRLVARAVATGSPVGPAVASFVLDARQAQRAERLAAVRRLPVRLLLPLTLLILPGFVVLTLGPALVSGLGRLRL